MKDPSLLLAIAALVSLPLSAAPCATGSLASYIALGSTGCTLGNLTVGSFTYQSSSSGGAAAITEDQITVTPLLIPTGTFGLKFTAPWDVQSGQGQVSDVFYRLASASTSSSVQQVTLEGSGFKGGLFTSAVVNEVLATPAVTGSLQIYEDCTEVCKAKTSATKTLTPSATNLVIFDKVTLTSKMGTTALSSFIDLFIVCIPCV